MMHHSQSKQSSFLRAFRLHRSGIRFLGAGLYCDAIHTLIHGLEVLEFSMSTEDSSPLKFARWKQVNHSRMYKEMDKKPMDHTCYTNEEWMTPMLKPCCNRCRGSLVGAMLYNMALAYHLHAMTLEQQQDSQLLYSYLNQASSLYSAAEGILQKNNVPIPQSLETNEQHVHWIICSRHIPDSSLICLQSSNSQSNGFHQTMLLGNEQNLEATICSMVQSSNQNTIEADFGSTMT